MQVVCIWRTRRANQALRLTGCNQNRQPSILPFWIERLGGLGNERLATLVWSSTSDQNFADLDAPFRVAPTDLDEVPTMHDPTLRLTATPAPKRPPETLYVRSWCGFRSTTSGPQILTFGLVCDEREASQGPKPGHKHGPHTTSGFIPLLTRVESDEKARSRRHVPRCRPVRRRIERSPCTCFISAHMVA